jgi:hypothetical protein
MFIQGDNLIYAAGKGDMVAVERLLKDDPNLVSYKGSVSQNSTYVCMVHTIVFALPHHIVTCKCSSIVTPPPPLSVLCSSSICLFYHHRREGRPSFKHPEMVRLVSALSC